MKYSEISSVKKFVANYHSMLQNVSDRPKMAYSDTKEYAADFDDIAMHYSILSTLLPYDWETYEDLEYYLTKSQFALDILKAVNAIRYLEMHSDRDTLQDDKFYVVSPMLDYFCIGAFDTSKDCDRYAFDTGIKGYQVRSGSYLKGMDRYLLTLDNRFITA